MPSKIAAPSRVVSRKALLPGRFNGSRTLLSPRENAKFFIFDHFSTTPEVPKALRRTSGSLPGTRSETRPDPESSLRINPSFSLRKTTLFRSQNCRLGATNQAPAPGPCKASFSTSPYTFSSTGPNSPDPQGRRIQRACGHMRRPWKKDRNPTSSSPTTQNFYRIQNSKLKAPTQSFRSKCRTRN